MIRLKKALLYGAKYAGVFWVCRLLTSKALRILCYHGASLGNEHEFSPGTFMRPYTFARRMAMLKKLEMPVLDLADALSKLQAHNLPKNSVTITIDDGWYGTYAHMLPVLKDLGFPATIYISSYYVENQRFVFGMFVDYVLTNAEKRVIDLSKVNPNLTGRFRLDDAEEREQVYNQVGSYAEKFLDALGKDELCRTLAAQLGLDAAQAEERRMLKFMNSDEVASLSGMGFDVQLHTHRHRFSPSNRDEAVQEILDNRNVLTRLGFPSAKHFCYPSGEHAPDHPGWLEELGIESAVTTHRGFCTARTSRFLLSRLCDSERMSDIEFEADLSGLLEILRRVRARLINRT